MSRYKQIKIREDMNAYMIEDRVKPKRREDGNKAAGHNDNDKDTNPKIQSFKHFSNLISFYEQKYTNKIFN